jgi:hypothetical protein
MTTILANRHLSTMHFPSFKFGEDLVEKLRNVCESFGFEVTYMDRNKAIVPKDIGLWIDKNGESRQKEEHTN